MATVHSIIIAAVNQKLHRHGRIQLSGYTRHARERHGWGLNMSCHRVEAGGGKRSFETVTQNVAAAIEITTFGTL